MVAIVRDTFKDDTYSLYSIKQLREKMEIYILYIVCYGYTMLLCCLFCYKDMWYYSVY